MEARKSFFEIFNLISPQPDNINESDDEWEEMDASESSNETTRNCVNRVNLDVNYMNHQIFLSYL